MKGLKRLLFVLLLVFGIFFWLEGRNYIALNDEIHEVQTKRNSKYTGVYTLTKLDKNGKNTWDGLIMYVDNDKLIVGAKYEYMTVKELSKAIDEDLSKYYNHGISGPCFDKDEINTKIMELAKTIDGCQVGNLGYQHLDTYLPQVNEFYFKGSKGILFGIGEFAFYKNKVDFHTDYSYIKETGLLAGYDRESQEIWLSKLLKNEKSPYFKGYKLIKHSKSSLDNCPLLLTGNFPYSIENYEYYDIKF